ncbi:MAG: UDP-N-acetylmuramoyl-L-alanyl-D-glutamate--2,6-diaminopimelate ligase [Draconibacterium sp.]|nr:MAG: UDP-N-acetylmuramoyl-L-alanyl-D-glutamate--2,6-diaminopimelate ligase [Draconibacterium sp.]
MKLRILLQHIDTIQIIGSSDLEIRSIDSNSRKIEPEAMFVARKGELSDGHLFITNAIEKGAVAIVCQTLPENLHQGVTYILVNNSDVQLGRLAAAFYGFPSRQIKVVGVTGTNGKTSIATLLYEMFMQLGYRSGLISTISYKVNNRTETATHTTPDALKIQKLLSQMVKEGCGYCFMEVSSHAVQQQRIEGVEFAGGLFTNITHDHLDYHKTFAAYIKAKKAFFDQLPADAFAITNIDDKNGQVMLQNTRAKKVTCSMRSMADFRCKVLENHFDGMLLNLDDNEVWTRFVGKFNASNLLEVYAAAFCLNQKKEEVLAVLSNLRPVKGRFETVRSNDGRLAIIDYAHTPDALKNVLAAIDEMRNHKEQVITVVGAGGDRDRAKRPEMAKEAVEASDKVILTSDNPRTENPAQIIKDMEAGVSEAHGKKVVSIENRREAIKTAALLAHPGDIILIAGKGHENYQEVNGVKHHFDDVEEIKMCFGVND